MNACILDCYVDEPACFGVPPFVSPYPRYIFGALVDAGIDEARIDYLTIDDIRGRDYRIPAGRDIVFLVGGAVVPGRYLGARIGSAPEISRIIESNPGHQFAVGGLISRLLEPARNAIGVRHDIEKYAHGLALGAPLDARRTTGEIARWAPLGAAVVKEHPRYPDLICEMETYRGCPRQRHCSFCSEGLMGSVEYRGADDILSEIDALAARGIRRFRLGRQADILQYGSECAEYRNGFPRPSPRGIAPLLAALRERIHRGSIEVLNIDNANPGTIAAYPEESALILEDLAETVTPGDTMALGIETFDDALLSGNNLKVTAREAIRAIETINEIGGRRRNGIPALLPGVNLLHGLSGESMETFEINYRHLAEILDRGLLVKRINIRRIVPFPGTLLFENRTPERKKIENRFLFYREKIRSDIEGPMLGSLYPPGTVIKGCQVLEGDERRSYGKQIASYSITARFPMSLPLMKFVDALVLGHRERSLAALPLPVSLNGLPAGALGSIPGIGRKRAAEIVLRRPFRSLWEAEPLLEGVPPAVRERIGL